MEFTCILKRIPKSIHTSYIFPCFLIWNSYLCFFSTVNTYVMKFTVFPKQFTCVSFLMTNRPSNMSHFKIETAACLCTYIADKINLNIRLTLFTLPFSEWIKKKEGFYIKAGTERFRFGIMCHNICMYILWYAYMYVVTVIYRYVCYGLASYVCISCIYGCMYAIVHMDVNMMSISGCVCLRYVCMYMYMVQMGICMCRSLPWTRRWLLQLELLVEIGPPQWRMMGTRDSAALLLCGNACGIDPQVQGSGKIRSRASILGQARVLPSIHHWWMAPKTPWWMDEWMFGYMGVCMCVCVCMYVCVSVCMYAMCMYVCMPCVCMPCVCMYVCMYAVCMYVCMYAVCMYVCMYAVCMSVCMYAVCMSVCMYAICMYACMPYVCIGGLHLSMYIWM